MRALTSEELWAEARARFGADPLNWAFVCPSCGVVSSGADFRAALEQQPQQRPTGQPVVFTDLLGQECITRLTGAPDGSDIACRRVAYGLIPGPWQVTLPGLDKPRSCFALAAAPVGGEGR
jgi:hypothetical protein